MQPSQPWPPGLRRAALVLLLAAAVMALGWIAPRRQAPPRLILGPDNQLEEGADAGRPEADLAYARQARRLIDGARQRLWMAMFVLRPDEGPIGGLLEALAAARARGVDVRVLLDRGPGWDGEPDLKHEAPGAWLAAHGVHVAYDDEAVTTHAKVVVADGRRILAGSHNWTRNAVARNRELSWLVEDEEAARRIEAWLAAIPGW